MNSRNVNVSYSSRLAASHTRASRRLLLLPPPPQQQQRSLQSLLLFSRSNTPLAANAARSSALFRLTHYTNIDALLSARLAAHRCYATSSSFDSSSSAYDGKRKDDTLPSRDGCSNSDNLNKAEEEEDGRDGVYSTSMPWGLPEDKESAEELYVAMGDEPSPASTTIATAAAARASADGSVQPANMNTNATVNVEKNMTNEEKGRAGSERGAASLTFPTSRLASQSSSDATRSTATGAASQNGDERQITAAAAAAANASTNSADTDSSTIAQSAELADASAAGHCGPWDDGGAGLVRRRVPQWYVPGLEREHQRSPAETPAPAPTISSAVAEAVSAALTGTSKKEASHDAAAAVKGEAGPPPATAAATAATTTTVTGRDASTSEKELNAITGGKMEGKQHAKRAADTHDGETAAHATKHAAAVASQATALDDAAPTPEHTVSCPASFTAAATSDTTVPATTTAVATSHINKDVTRNVPAEQKAARSDGMKMSLPPPPPLPLPPATAIVTAASGDKAKDSKGTAASSAPGSAETRSASTATSDVKKEVSKMPEKAKDTNEKEESDDDDGALPKALLTVQASRNKRIKRLLMASLGSDFAKAGLRNDGVRTSFSVVNYQTIKQLTGLSHIPSTLLISCLVAPENEFSWIDISMHPTATLSEYKEALQEVLLGLGMHHTMVEDSAESMLLPQVTVTKGCYSLLMRYAIEAPANKQMDSFQDLTNRFTVFITQARIITVHRTQCSYVEALKLNWQHYLSGDGAGAISTSYRDARGFFVSENDFSSSSSTPRGVRYLMYYFVKETVGTFTQAIARCIVEFDHYEADLFNTQRNRSSMAREIYHIKRRASVYGRTLTLTQDAYAHIATALQISTSQVGYQEIMHDLAHVESLAEELNSNADSVLQLLFQLSSYQVNELMRVLTLFSAFFIPLSFIASVYGMNFEDLPMLHNEYGGVFCGMLMLTVATCIYLWFRSNRFL